MTADPEISGRREALRRVARLIATPIAIVIAILYFVIDAVFLPLTRPIIRYAERRLDLDNVAAWLRRQGPYTTLLIVLVPLAILEPAKPIGLYFIATNRAIRGIALLVVAELIKLTLVERLFSIGRDKLMTIRLFAIGYKFVMRWLRYLKSLRAWKLAMRLAEMGKKATHYGISRIRR